MKLIQQSCIHAQQLLRVTFKICTSVNVHVGFVFFLADCSTRWRSARSWRKPSACGCSTRKTTPTTSISPGGENQSRMDKTTPRTANKLTSHPTLSSRRCSRPTLRPPAWARCTLQASTQVRKAKMMNNNNQSINVKMSFFFITKVTHFVEIESAKAFRAFSPHLLLINH